MKENTGVLILTALLISMIDASIAAYKVEAKNCGCKPKTVFNSPKEIFEIN